MLRAITEARTTLSTSLLVVVLGGGAFASAPAAATESPSGRETNNSSESERPDEAGNPSSPEPTGPEDSAGDEGETDEDLKYFGDAHRRELYRDGRLQYSTAALRTALLPGLGNFYAEQYLLGGLHATLMAFAAVVIPYGLATDQAAFAWGGAGLAGSAYVSGFATSALGVRRYNRRLRRRLRLADEPAAGTPWEPTPPATVTLLSVSF